MPRRDSNNSREARPIRPERARSMERRAPVNVDEQALSLREANASYSSIARRLSLKRATDAHRAFVRALSSRGTEEQRNLVANEQARLDKLEVRIKDRDAHDPEKLQRRLEAVAKLRASLP
jgi:hypothetical protein